MTNPPPNFNPAGYYTPAYYTPASGEGRYTGPGYGSGSLEPPKPTPQPSQMTEEEKKEFLAETEQMKKEYLSAGQGTLRRAELQYGWQVRDAISRVIRGETVSYRLPDKVMGFNEINKENVSRFVDRYYNPPAVPSAIQEQIKQAQGGSRLLGTGAISSPSYVGQQGYTPSPRLPPGYYYEKVQGEQPRRKLSDYTFKEAWKAGGVTYAYLWPSAKLEKYNPLTKVKLSISNPINPISRYIVPKTINPTSGFNLLRTATALKKVDIDFSKPSNTKLIDLTIKSGIFQPAISAGEAGIFVRRKKQLLEGRFAPEESITATDAEIAIREAYIRGDAERVRELLRKAYESGDKNIIKKTESIVKDSLGKNVGSTLIKDVRGGVFLRPSVPMPKKLPLETIRLPKQPIMENVGSTFPASKYAGTGQYELTSPEYVYRARTPSPKNPLRTSTAVLDIQNTVPKYAQSSKEMQLFRFNQAQKTQQLTKFRSSESLKQPQNVMQLQKQSQATLQAQSLKLKQQQKQQQLLKLKLKLNQELKQPSQLKFKTKFKGGGGFKSSSPSYGFAQPKETTQATASYDVFTKIKGKPVLLASNLPFGKATKTGAEYTERTIAASFSLKPKGLTTAKDIKYRLPEMFRPSKRTPGTIVEKSKYRLNYGLEKSTIQKARKFKWF